MQDNTTNATNNQNPEFDNDDFIYESMLSQGHTPEEASKVLFNLYHYGSPGSPDDIPENNVFSEEFQSFLDGLDAMMAGASMK